MLTKGDMSKIGGSTTKFEVEKFNGKENFSLWQKRIKSAKPAGMSNEDWEEMDLKAASTIQLCLPDEVMYNVMDEETTTGLWSRLETLYMMKSLSNKLCLKKQLYGPCMNEGTVMMEHLNFFKKVISELLTIDVKIDEEDKMLILLSSLIESYDYGPVWLS